MSEATVTNIPTEANALARLREPFPPECVGKLPRVTQKDGTKGRCAECGGYLPPHIHLDYVGHAEVTDRLLSVDPLWTWEPVAFDDRGVPVITQGAGGDHTLWIRLTVCGMTRLGVGSVMKNAFDAEKQLISDAIRNAAMRFGVALDLWAKEELESSLDGSGTDRATGEITAPAATVRRPPPGRAAAKGKEEPKEHPVSTVTNDGGGAPITDGAPATTVRRPPQRKNPPPDETPTVEEREDIYRRLTSLPNEKRHAVEEKAKGRVPNVRGAQFTYDHWRIINELLIEAEGADGDPGRPFEEPTS